MPYIVTHPLNREQRGFWYLESLDQLPAKIAEFAASERNGLSDDCEASDVWITGIYEVTGEVPVPPGVHAEAQVKLVALRASEAARRAADQRLRDERELKRLQERLGKT